MLNETGDTPSFTCQGSWNRNVGDHPWVGLSVDMLILQYRHYSCGGEVGLSVSMLNSSTPCTMVKVMVGHHKVVQDFILKLACLYKRHSVIPQFWVHGLHCCSGCLATSARR